MATSNASDFLAKAISDNKIVTFRLLSRELSIHVNEAKNYLASYHAASSTSPQPVHATYLVSGDVTITVPVPLPSSESQDSTPPSTQPDLADATRVERRIVLAGETEVDKVKAQLSRVSCVHIYSIASAPIKNSASLATPMAQVRNIDSERGVDHARRVGMTVAPNAQWAKGKRSGAAASETSTKAKAKAPVIEKQPLKSTTGSAAATPGLAKPPPAEEKKKTSTLDWSKGKPKEKAADPPVKVKTEGSTPAPAKKAATGKLDFAKAPPKAKSPAPAGEVKEVTKAVTKSEPTAISSKSTLQVPGPAKARVSTARPASKQRPDTTKPTSKPPSDASDDNGKAETKKTDGLPLPVVGNPMARNPKTSATSSGIEVTITSDSDVSDKGQTSKSRVKKGRVISDEEEENSEEEAATKKAAGKKRKSVALSEEESEERQGSEKRSRLKKGKTAADERRQSKFGAEKELQKLMDSDEDDEDVKPSGSRSASSAVDNDDEANNSAPEHVPHTKHIRGLAKKEKPTGVDVAHKKPRKSKTKAPLGSNGRPKKMVVKKVETKKGKYSSFEDVEEWITDPDAQTEEESEQEETKPKKKNAKKVKVEDETEDVESADDSSKPKPKPKPRPSAGKRKASTSEGEMEEDKPKQAKQPKVSSKPRASTGSTTEKKSSDAKASKAPAKSSSGPKTQKNIGSFFQKK